MNNSSTGMNSAKNSVPGSRSRCNSSLRATENVRRNEKAEVIVTPPRRLTAAAPVRLRGPARQGHEHILQARLRLPYSQPVQAQLGRAEPVIDQRVDRLAEDCRLAHPRLVPQRLQHGRRVR